MSEAFSVTHKEEEEIIKQAFNEVSTLLATLDNALNEIARYLLKEESISIEECRNILRRIF